MIPDGFDGFPRPVFLFDYAPAAIRALAAGDLSDQVCAAPGAESRTIMNIPMALAARGDCGGT